MDKVSVPISDNVKRNMSAFANRPELMKQYTTSSKYAGVHRHNMMLVIGVRANIHLGGQTEFGPNGFSGGGGSSRNFPGSILCGGGVVAEIFRVPYYVGWQKFFR